MLKAVLFDVDFTIARPGPELGPEGYRRLGERFGLELDPSRYGEARERAVEGIKRHPELEHDEEIWVAFTERIIRGMGGDADSAYECAVEMTRAWEHAEHFELFEDAPPVLEELRAQGLKLGLVSNTGRDLDAFEKMDLAFHRRVREGYLEIARAEKNRVRVLDAGRDAATLHADVARAVEELLERRGAGRGA